MMLAEKDVSLVGSWCYLITDWPRIIRLIASGKYPVGQAVTAQIKLEDVVPQGFDVPMTTRGPAQGPRVTGVDPRGLTAPSLT